MATFDAALADEGEPTGEEPVTPTVHVRWSWFDVPSMSVTVSPAVIDVTVDPRLSAAQVGAACAGQFEWGPQVAEAWRDGVGMSGSSAGPVTPS
jgi:hypothetical protein